MSIQNQTPNVHLGPPIVSPTDNGKLLLAPISPCASWWRMVSAGVAALFLGLGALQLFPLVAHSLALLILAISIAAALAPLVKWLERWIPRLAVILLVYFVLVLLMAAIFQILLPVLVTQIQAFGERAPDSVAKAQQTLDQWNLGVSLKDAVLPQLGQLSTTLMTLPLTILSSLFDIVLVLVISIYWLLAALPMRDYFFSIFPVASHPQAGVLLGAIGASMGGYIRATFINGFVIGVLTYIGLFALGVQYPLVLGLSAGLLELVPIVGPIISALIVVAVTLMQSSTQALIALGYMFVLQQLEGNLLVPNVMRSQTEISPLVAILALYTGSAIGGLLGALIAIPVASAIQVVSRELVVPAVRRWTGAGVVETPPESVRPERTGADTAVSSNQG